MAGLLGAFQRLSSWLATKASLSKVFRIFSVLPLTSLVSSCIISKEHERTPSPIPSFGERYMVLYKHILDLTEENEIKVLWSKSYNGRAYRKTRTIKIPDVKTHITYAIALHEIGHIVGKQTGNRVNREAQAWLWARENALEWTPVMGEKAVRCIQSYLDWSRRRKNVWVPPENHISWEIAKW